MVRVWGLIDLDDRVRAISLAMGMVPIIWTRAPDGSQFDTNGPSSPCLHPTRKHLTYPTRTDWRVPGGTVNGTESFATFEQILTSASQLETGFIVLQHDLYQQTVDLAIGHTLDAARRFQPQLTVRILSFPPIAGIEI